MAPKKGSMSSRILFGHLLGLGFRHSSSGSSLGLGDSSESGFGGLSDRYLGAGIDLAVKKLGCNARCARELRGSSRARVRRNEGRKGGMTGQLRVGWERKLRCDHWGWCEVAKVLEEGTN
jgi:hypothetical protein